MHNLLQKMKNNQKGYSLVELILVMVLMLLFGITIFTLILSGTQAYQKITRNKTAQEDARTALSYLNVRLRQGDIASCVWIDDLNGAPALAILDPYSDEQKTTYIFEDHGMLLECITTQGNPPSAELSFDIVPALDFQVVANTMENALSFTITYSQGEDSDTLSSRVVLRAAQDFARRLP